MLIVSESTPAKLDDELARFIRDWLFDQWLSVERQTAKIEWSWGCT